MPSHPPPSFTPASSAILSTILALLLGPSGIASPARFIVLPGFSQQSGPHSSTLLPALLKKNEYFHHWDFIGQFTEVENQPAVYSADMGDMNEVFVL